MPQRSVTPSTIANFLAILLSTFLAAAAAPAAAQQPPIHLNSPSGKLRATILGDVDGAHHLAWSLQLNGKTIVLPSSLGIDIASADLGQDVQLGAPVLSTNNTSYPWKGVHNIATDHYRQALIPVTQNHTGIRYTLECRVFDDGFAFRYIVRPHPSQITNGSPSSITNDEPGSLVTGESTSWHLPAGSKVWYQENVYYYEGLHYTSLIENLGAKQLGPPVTYQTTDGYYAS
ncbi:MAG TPA: glycoside hydrolase family 97 N-terminal domain-containing protein, partial [Puia sp.]|nr:glycoside hydrolase family 97 N-terminal domain-containing protein [Puia sp.]